MIQLLSKWRGWDRAGILLSLGCAVHCLVAAFLPSLLGAQQDSCCSHSDEWSFHSVALIFVMVIASMVCFRCCSNSGWSTLIKLVAGLSLMWAPQLSVEAAQWETAFTVSGAALVGWAHWSNLRSVCGSQPAAGQSTRKLLDSR